MAVSSLVSQLPRCQLKRLDMTLQAITLFQVLADLMSGRKNATIVLSYDFFEKIVV